MAQKSMRDFQFAILCIFLLDMIINPFTGIEKEDNAAPEPESESESEDETAALGKSKLGRAQISKKLLANNKKRAK